MNFFSNHINEKRNTTDNSMMQTWIIGTPTVYTVCTCKYDPLQFALHHRHPEEKHCWYLLFQKK